MLIRGHTLIYYRSTPIWLAEGDWSRDELIEIMREHIFTVMGRYRGQIHAWDVVNEAFERDGSYRSNLWYDIIGPEYIELAFQFAREADPDALLFYNDVDAEGLNRRSNAIYSMAQDFKARGVPLDGIGLQMHSNAASFYAFPSPERIERNMARLGALGLQIHITEMDVRLRQLAGDSAARLAQQADIYASVAQLCLNEPACTALNFWGFTDKYSWIYNHFGGRYPDEAPLIYDPEYRPKPAYYALGETLRAGPTQRPGLLLNGLAVDGLGASIVGPFQIGTESNEVWFAPRPIIE
jgi:endo-1,4-beta-xylanase